MTEDRTRTPKEQNDSETTKLSPGTIEAQPMNNPMFAKLGGRRRRRGSSVVIFLVVAGIVAIIAAVGVYFLTR